MSGQAWKYSDQLDDMDLKMMKRDFFTYKIGMDYYGFSIRPLMRIAREAGAFSKIYSSDRTYSRIIRYGGSKKITVYSCS